jgi:hypothetical protein
MEISGKIIQLLPKQTGQGKNGVWEKQDYVLETEGKFPKKVCFNIWGEKIAQFNIQEGDAVQVSFDLESREYNGRWYTDVRAWNIQKTSAAAPGVNAPQEEDLMPFDDGAGDPFASTSGNSDDLPF